MKRRAVIIALVLCAAGVPALPTNEMKLAGTLLAGGVLMIGGYLFVRSGEPITATPLDAPLIAFLALAVLSTVFAPDPWVSLVPSLNRREGLIDYVVYVPMALAAARLSRLEVREILEVVLAAAAPIAAIGVGQYYGVDAAAWIGGRGFDYGLRGWGTLGNPDFLGGYIALVLPIGIALAAGAGERRRWWWCAAASILLYAALLGSQTRSAWAASGLAAIVLLWRLPRSRQVSRRLTVLGLTFVAVTAAMIVTQPAVSLRARAQSAAAGAADSSMQGKLWIWQHVLPMIRARPVLGWGFSAIAGHLPDIGTPGYYRVFGRSSLVIDVAHNDLLQVAVNMGLAGVAAYLWVWAAALRAAHDAGRRAASPVSAEAAGILGGLIAYFVWLQFLWSHIGAANVFWVLAGAAIALRRAGHSESPESAPR